MNNRLSFRFALVILLIFSLMKAGQAAAAGEGATAGSKTFAWKVSGTNITVPLDLDFDSCSASPPYVCTDLSVYGNYAGKITGGGSLSGAFTGQSVIEVVPAPATGSSCLLSSAIASCTIPGDTATDACLFNVAGGSFVNMKSSTLDLFFGPYTGGTSCIDFNGFAGPWTYATAVTASITGGTGKLKSVSGTLTATFTGQVLNWDSQGHSFGYATGTGTGTMP